MWSRYVSNAVAQRFCIRMILGEEDVGGKELRINEVMEESRIDRLMLEELRIDGVMHEELMMDRGMPEELRIDNRCNPIREQRIEIIENS
jgi:hypothetical protein